MSKKSLIVGTVIGFGVGVWFASQPMPENRQSRLYSLRYYFKITKRSYWAFLPEFKSRLYDAYKQGWNAAKRERYNAHMEDWDLNNPNL